MTIADDDTVLETVLRRDRYVVIAGLITVIVVAWLWLLLDASAGMSAMDMTLGSSARMVDMMAPAVWSLRYAGVMFTMWWVMMAAMMLPSAAPILLLFARVNRQQNPHASIIDPSYFYSTEKINVYGRALV